MLKQDFRGHLARPAASIGKAGIDLDADASSRIIAPAKGILMYAKKNDPIYGSWAIIHRGFGFYSDSQHFDRFHPSFLRLDGTVRTGVMVEAGQDVGKGVDRNAFATYPYPHVHYRESKTNIDKFPLDAEYFGPSRGCLPYFERGVLSDTSCLLTRVQKLGDGVQELLLEIDALHLTEQQRPLFEKLKSYGDPSSTTDQAINARWHKGVNGIDFYADEKPKFIYGAGRFSPYAKHQDLAMKAHDVMATYLPVVFSPVVR